VEDENQRLKSMLEAIRKSVMILKQVQEETQKQPVSMVLNNVDANLLRPPEL
jgi:hypothetical protein